MTGYLTDHKGNRQELPVLLRWELNNTLGEPADSFSLCFRYEPEWENVLCDAVYFQAVDRGTIRFTGLVDEYELSADSDGTLATLHGRGMAARLLDNEVGEADYYWARLTDMIRIYCKPYGIDKVVYDEDWRLGTYAVPYGVTAWQALCGFCMWSAGVQPRFLPDGTLLITAGEGQRRTLSQPGKVRSARFSCCRYGVYSHVLAKYAGLGTCDREVDGEFAARGGMATKCITIPRRRSCRAGASSPLQVLTASKEDYRVLELTLWELYPAEPGDLIRLELEKLGISGTFRVREVRNGWSGEGSLSRLTMSQC